MTPRCALCGRLTLHPAAHVGALPVGPKCARRAGLIEAKRRTRLFDCVSRVVDDGETPDLFTEETA